MSGRRARRCAARQYAVVANVVVGLILLVYRAAWEWWYRTKGNRRSSVSRWSNHAVTGLIALALISAGLGFGILAGAFALAVGVLGLALIVVAVRRRQPSL